ncbi:MAG: hypothetical protein ACE366_07655 [Bradymonadia bacterium]
MTRFNTRFAALRNPLTIVPALMAMALIGCDVQDGDDSTWGQNSNWDTNESPPETVDPGGGAEEGTEENPEESANNGTTEGDFVYVVIRDVSEGYNDEGTPGVDICGVSFVCDDGTEGWASRAELDTGAGFICGEDDLECLADRGDAMAAIGQPEAFCEPRSVPSEYVSLGVGGELTLRMMVPGDPGALEARGGLAGCTLVVHELDGMTHEAYTVNVCDSAAGDNCQSENPMVMASNGGSVSVEVPMAAPEETEDEMVAVND